jgi:hypothetical protein
MSWANLMNSKWDWVIPSAFARVIASSGTCGSLWLRISCYSWWLSPPRWVGAAVEVRHMLVTVRGRLRWSCEGSCTFSSEEPHGSYSKLLVSLSYLTCGSVLTVSNVWTRFVQHLLAAELPSVGRHSVPASTWTFGEKSCVSIVIDSLDFSRWLVFFLLWLVHSSTRRYKNHNPLIYIPTN